MGNNRDIEAFLVEYGLTNLAVRLTAETGNAFSAQQVNHWKRRGVPYKWLDVVTKISKLSKPQLRGQQSEY